MSRDIFSSLHHACPFTWDNHTLCLFFTAKQNWCYICAQWILFTEIINNLPDVAAGNRPQSILADFEIAPLNTVRRLLGHVYMNVSILPQGKNFTPVFIESLQSVYMITWEWVSYMWLISLLYLAQEWVLTPLYENSCKHIHPGVKKKKTIEFQAALSFFGPFTAFSRGLRFLM